MEGFICILFVILLFGCVDQSETKNIFSDFNFDAKKYVNLYDYRNIHIDYDFIEVSEQDIETVINNDLSYYECYKPINKNTVENEDIVSLQILSKDNSNYLKEFYYTVGSSELGEDTDSLLINMKINEELYINIGDIKDIEVRIKGIYTYATYKDTDIVCSYYQLDNMDKVYESIKERTKNEIIFNYMYDEIMEKSKVKRCPSIVNEYIKKYEKEIKDSARKANLSVEEFAKQNANMTFSELIKLRKDYYYEIMIMNAILESENQEITMNEVERNIKNTASENNIDEEEVKNNYFEDVYYDTIYKKLKTVLVKYIIIDSK